MGMTVAEIKAEISKFDRQAQAAFLTMFEVKAKKILDKFGRVMTTVPSDGPAEKYPFPKATPQLVEYEEGNVPTSEFGAETLTITNKLFGNSISIGRTFFEDIGRMPAAKQQYITNIAGLSVRGANYPVKLAADLLLEEGIFANTLAYDGKKMFATDHAEGANKFAGNNTYTTAQIKVEHEAVLDMFTAHKDPDGEDLLREEAPNELLILVDPAKMMIYAEFYRSVAVPDYGGVAAAIANVLAPDNKGMMRGVDGLGNAVNIVGWSRLRGKAKTFYFDVTDDLPGPAPILHQQRLAPELEFLGAGSDQFTIAEQLTWKLRMRGNLGIGNYNKAALVTK